MMWDVDPVSQAVQSPHDQDITLPAHNPFSVHEFPQLSSTDPVSELESLSVAGLPLTCPRVWYQSLSGSLPL